MVMDNGSLRINPFTATLTVLSLKDNQQKSDIGIP